MLFAISPAFGQVELRGGEAAPSGAVIGVSEAGVSLGTAGAPAGSTPSEVIGWDRVKSVGGAWGEKAAPFMPGADQAWRARARLERGDAIAAEPLFEALFAKTRGEKGPTAAVVAEGLLRCRVRRAAHVAAVEPWLAMLEAGADQAGPVLHANWAADAGLATVIDASGIAPSLPPMWLAWPSVEAYARSTPWLGASGASKAVTARVAALATLYHQAAQFEAGQPVAWSDMPGNDPAVQLVAQVVAARVGDPDRRAAARKALLERLKTVGHGRAEDGTAAAPAVSPWLEAWVHAAVGRSLLREDSTEQKQAGVLELLQLPARYASAHPYLAGIALAESSVALRGMGDIQGADALARELMTLYPTHPVNDWGPFAASKPKPAAASAGAAGATGSNESKGPSGLYKP